MSKLSKLGHFFQRVGKIAPAILVFTPLAPIAGPITAAIQEAEAIHGASTGAEKLAHVVAVAKEAAKVANAAAGHTVVNEVGIEAAAAHAIGAVVSAANAVHPR